MMSGLKWNGPIVNKEVYNNNNHHRFTAIIQVNLLASTSS